MPGLAGVDTILEIRREDRGTNETTTPPEDSNENDDDPPNDPSIDDLPTDPIEVDDIDEEGSDAYDSYDDTADFREDSDSDRNDSMDNNKVNFSNTTARFGKPTARSSNRENPTGTVGGKSHREHKRYIDSIMLEFPTNPNDKLFRSYRYGGKKKKTNAWTVQDALYCCTVESSCNGAILDDKAANVAR
ncbi:hypothetical protein QQS21_007668 [Conoideocrella luteorostrata]|uniref:Uncharacterized protein n=1 Tax=Conoideocrella luteorostrata TaxID=1105319 RepID=A0AAJ0CKA5_9HYPO|nr:hypothetical protein QQS21_007668 [Conoideocrella luteorostrata]